MLLIYNGCNINNGYPKSCQDVKNIIKDYKERMDKLLNLNLLNISSFPDSDSYLLRSYQYLILKYIMKLI